MLKRGYSLALLGLLFEIGFVSAQSSFGDFLNGIGASNITLFLIFGISSLILKWGLQKSFGRDNSIASIIALLLGFGITAAAHFTGFAYNFDLNNLFYDLGIPVQIIVYGVPILFLGLIYFFARKTNFGLVLAILGGILILTVAFTDFFYQSGTIAVIGTILLVLGIWLMWRRHRKNKALPPTPAWVSATGGFAKDQVKKGWEKTWAGTGGMIAEKRRLQREYDKQKTKFNDDSLPDYVRKRAEYEMRRIVLEADKKEIRIDY